MATGDHRRLVHSHLLTALKAPPVGDIIAPASVHPVGPPARPQVKSRNAASTRDDRLQQYLRDCRSLVQGEIGTIIPAVRHGRRLYELMCEYPLRGGKALRPALCIATCRALGGMLEAVLRSAAAIELYHNAFLVHDDVEDGSELRRSEPTLHRKYGVPIAVNVGDGMLALSMMSLLANTETIGVGRALRVLDTVSRMARESAEGQMMELDWIARASWALHDQSYLRMVFKKTTWYSFITPVRVGVIASGASNDRMIAFTRFAARLGVAFQIQDDVLNLTGSGEYGKEIAGDLWEGKHTLILIHAIRSATPADRAEAIRILAKPRPPEHVDSHPRAYVRRFLDELHEAGQLTARDHERLAASVDDRFPTTHKTQADVEFLRALVDRHDGIGYAAAVAERHAAGAGRSFSSLARRLTSSAHLEFLADLVQFVIRRTQ
jgi:geranylgeranyl diphosphate synthase, type II